MRAGALRLYSRDFQSPGLALSGFNSAELTSDLVTFETISHLPCLALLGEPGIGKTQALEMERSKIVSIIQEQGDQVLFLDLRSYGSEDRLVRSLFGSPEFKAWQAGTHRLHIFLDSFDECLLRVDTLATLLVDEFKHHQNAVHRLCLRIACRTAVWPPVLEEGLKEIWGKNSVGVYELAPLRRIDVIEAAKAKRCSPAILRTVLVTFGLSMLTRSLNC